MALKKGHSSEVVSHNIKEMMRSGYKQKQAVAASLANARKYKKMAEGGLVGEDEEEGDLESQLPEYPMHSDKEGLSPNVERAEMLARGLQAARMKANDNTNDFEEDDSVAGSKMNLGGLVQDDTSGDMKYGNKPDLEWIDDGTEEAMSDEPSKDSDLGHAMESSVPMSMGLSEEAKEAIRAKRSKRRYGQYNPV